MAFNFDNIKNNHEQLNNSIVDYATCLYNKDIISTLIRHNSNYNNFFMSFKPIKYTNFGYVYSILDPIKEEIRNRKDGKTYKLIINSISEEVYSKIRSIERDINDNLSFFLWSIFNCHKVTLNKDNIDLLNNKIFPEVFDNANTEYAIPNKVYLTNDELIYVVIMPLTYSLNDNPKYVYNDFICLNPNKIEEAKEKYFNIKKFNNL